MWGKFEDYYLYYSTIAIITNNTIAGTASAPLPTTTDTFPSCYLFLFL